MEIRLEGKIKAIVKDFGFIHCEAYNFDYYFHNSSLTEDVNFQIGDSVSFSLRANRGREGNHAHQIIKIESSKKYNDKVYEKQKLKFYFDSRDDMLLGLKHIREKLTIQKSKCQSNYNEPEFVIEEIDNLLNVINDLFDGPSPNINDISFEEINLSTDKGLTTNRYDKNYWKNSFNLQNFGNDVQAISAREIEKGKFNDFSIIWHEWKNNKRQVFNSGYIKGFFNYSFLEKGATTQTSVYDTPPPVAKWKLNKIEQKGYYFFITSAPVREVAQSSSVPALPPKLGVLETVERILDKNRNNTEWQREIDPARVNKIKQFIGESTNIVANTPMLFINDESAISINGDYLEIDFGKFLQKQTSGEFNGQYIDRKAREEKDEFGNIVYDDYRPFWIIDGQHRVRGIHLNEDSQELQIPLIVFPRDFSMSNTAKVFAEINTLQKKLDPLHELFMQHRFSIDHPTNIKRKFKDYKSVSREEAELNGWSLDDWDHSRANHLAYEVLAKLAKNGPLKDRVQFLPQNTDSQSFYISADQWVNYARTLFERKCYKYKYGIIEDYIVNPTENEKSLDIVEFFYLELNNYFKAWVETCNHNEWPDKRNRWVNESKGKALIQKKTHFILLIELYSLIRDLAQEYKIKFSLFGVIKVEEFMEILKPFKWVDWQSKELEDTYPGSGEKGRRSLEVWMADAILNKEQFSNFEIFDSTIKSLPGRGINSVLGIPSLSIVSKNLWPTKSEPVIFKSIRPWNARYESSWKVSDDNQDIKAEMKISTSKHLSPTEVEFVLKHENYMDDVNLKYLEIRVDWKNSHTQTGKNIISISKLI
ncbi:DGQHR domain-containing protein [Aquirufa sp. OSTEICH-129V]|uniref:DGQHR domain-containing protein n=1 Tax=Aquirufa avitistagni TaxID=3104728 RepID=A0ABW6D900_9BACT